MKYIFLIFLLLANQCLAASSGCGPYTTGVFFCSSNNMGLPIPTVGVETGPFYANDLNQAFSLIDAHDHTAGNGVLVPTAGLNINANLAFNNSAATSLQACTYTAQSSFATNLSTYVKGVDLYYRDGNGNEVRLTQAGGSPSFTNALTFSAQGAASTPAVSITGAPYTGGSSTTTKPLVLIENASTSNNWQTVGTELGINAATGFTGNLIDAQVNGSPKFQATASGSLSLAGTQVFNATPTLQAAAFPALTGDISNSAGSVSITAASTQPNIATLSLSTGVAVKGTNTNNNASAGYYAEVSDASLTRANEFSLTSGTTVNVTSQAGGTGDLSLTAGDWEISGSISFETSAASTITAGSINYGFSTTSATQAASVGVPSNGQIQLRPSNATPASTIDSFLIAPIRVSIADRKSVV